MNSQSTPSLNSNGQRSRWTPILTKHVVFLGLLMCTCATAQAPAADDAPKTRGVFVAAFVSTFAPGLANSVVDWIGKKVFGSEPKGQQSYIPPASILNGQPNNNGGPSNAAADNRNPRTENADGSTLALIIEAHQVSSSDEVLGRLTREGSDTITLSTGDRFILKFFANMPGLLSAENVDAQGVTTNLGSFAIPAGEGVSIPKAKAFRMVGQPGQEQLRLVFQPCRAYSSTQVRTRGVANEDQASSMVQSDRMMNANATSAIEDCANVDVTRLAMVATRGIQNENFPGGIAMTSTAKTVSGKIMSVSRTVTLVHTASTSPRF